MKNFKFFKEWKEQAKEVPFFAIGFPIIGAVLLITMIFAITSCQPKICPAYAKNNIEHGKVG